MISPTALAIVAVGGAIGAALRYATTAAALRWLGPAFPYGTLAVNVVGSLLMGVIVAALVERAPASPKLALFVTTGFCGGFTTFSAFSLDTLYLIERGEAGKVALYMGGSVALSILALGLGIAAGRALA
ncbi:MAG: fluoride efflux transporter CrcB [Rhodobacteraceae bacterium]|nr:MAG: fluoride efflux transporter CrcB [Paracoccaceae bacterium]